MSDPIVPPENTAVKSYQIAIHRLFFHRLKPERPDFILCSLLKTHPDFLRHAIRCPILLVDQTDQPGQPQLLNSVVRPEWQALLRLPDPAPNGTARLYRPSPLRPRCQKSTAADHNAQRTGRPLCELSPLSSAAAASSPQRPDQPKSTSRRDVPALMTQKWVEQ